MFSCDCHQNVAVARTRWTPPPTESHSVGMTELCLHLIEKIFSLLEYERAKRSTKCN